MPELLSPSAILSTLVSTIKHRLFAWIFLQFLEEKKGRKKKEEVTLKLDAQ
jgi:hypothetical protein